MASLGSLIFDFNSRIHGHHVNQDVWTPFTGEELTVQQDNSNKRDNYVVGVLKDDVVVGHVPKGFSRVVWALHSTRRSDFL